MISSAYILLRKKSVRLNFKLYIYTYFFFQNTEEDSLIMIEIESHVKKKIINTKLVDSLFCFLLKIILKVSSVKIIPLSW